ncbi:MAG: DUF2157 domain-containing protein [Halioglobus sp.]|nr:DUF2157 domain-containing protein [Halioglobus sp.]
MATKDEALEKILAIMHSQNLTVEDVEAVVDTSRRQLSDHRSRFLSGILGLLGGVFVFSGISIFIALNWDVMNTAARIISTLGSGLAVFIIALVAAEDERYVKARVPLYLIASALQPTGILVAIDEFSSGGDWHHAVLITAALMTFQQATAFWQKRDSVLLFTSIFFLIWFSAVLLDLFGADEGFIALFLGSCILAMCIAIERTPYRGVTSFWYFMGGFAFFGGLFTLIQHTVIELLFISAACGGVILSTYIRSRILLFVSTVALLGYISYFTSEHFVDSFGWPIVLMFLGLVLIGLSSAALRVSRRYMT